VRPSASEKEEEVAYGFTAGYSISQGLDPYGHTGQYVPGAGADLHRIAPSSEQLAFGNAAAPVVRVEAGLGNGPLVVSISGSAHCEANCTGRCLLVVAAGPRSGEQNRTLNPVRHLGRRMMQRRRRRVAWWRRAGRSERC